MKPGLNIELLIHAWYCYSETRGCGREGKKREAGYVEFVASKSEAQKHLL